MNTTSGYAIYWTTAQWRNALEANIHKFATGWTLDGMVALKISYHTISYHTISYHFLEDFVYNLFLYKHINFYIQNALYDDGSALLWPLW